MSFSRKSTSVLLLLAVAGLGVLAFAWSAGSSSGSQEKSEGNTLPTREVVADTLRCTGSSEKPNFETFGLGDSYRGLELVETLRRCDEPYPGEPVAANYVSYIYGDCKLEKVEEGRVGCQPPLEVQTWPSCHRSLADYPAEMIREASRVPDAGGAAVINFEDDRMEIYTGEATVVLFSSDAETLEGVADQLGDQPYLQSKEWLRDAQAGKRLPEVIQVDASKMVPPAEGAMEGKIACS